MPSTNVEAVSSAALLEPAGIHTLDVGHAMDEVVAALSKNRPQASAAYGVFVIHGARHQQSNPNMLKAATTFFRAYLRGWDALSQADARLSNNEVAQVQDIENTKFGHVRFFLAKDDVSGLKERVKPSPGFWVYILTAHLDSALLEELGLPALPERYRNQHLVMQVEHPVEEARESAEMTRTWIDWERAFEPAEAEEDRIKEAIARDTLEWRQQFMRVNECWTSTKVAEESTSTAKNRASIASRWLQERKIFAIKFQAQQYFPRFQFQNGTPVPVIAQVIRTFPEHANGWDLAYFFATPNPNIQGCKPLELVRSDPARVVSLAEAFLHPANVF